MMWYIPKGPLQFLHGELPGGPQEWEQGTSEATAAVQEEDAGGLDSGRMTWIKGRKSCFIPR